MTGNIIGIYKTSIGFRTINIHLTDTNPAYIKFNDDIPGKASDCRITHLSMTMGLGGVKPDIAQIEMDGIHTNTNTTYQCMTSALQVPVSQKTSVPFSFQSNKCPQWMRVGVYGPGEPGTPLVFDATIGCHITITYQFIPQ